MTETLFLRYKEALRRGHLAAARGRLEDAAAAYRDAVSIAADRAVPRAALGRVLLRLGEPEEALAAYEAADRLAPGEDGSILGRAQALVVLRRTAEAASAYDVLAALREAAGQPAAAAEAARRALAIEPSPVREARHAALAAAARAAAGSPGEAGADAPAGASERESGAGGGAERSTTPDGPESPSAGAPVVDLGPDPEGLVASMEEAIGRGDADAAGGFALAAARGYRARGRLAAAVDACLQGIGARPADADLHLLLADLAIERGWPGQAGETYRNLLRLVELDGDAGKADAIRAAAARLPAARLLGGG